MMLFALLKKDFLIVKKYVLIMLVVIALIPPVMRWRTPEFTGVFGFILSVIFGIFILLQYCIPKRVSISKSCDITMCHTIFTESNSFIKIHFLHGYICNLLYRF